MRLRAKRKPRSQLAPPQQTVAQDSGVDSTSPVTWSVEQLNALGPLTGPGHRSVVPIVRSTLRDTLLEDVTEIYF